MDEHFALLDLAGDIRRALAAGDHATAKEQLSRLARLLALHVGREERGIFTALKRQGDFADTVAELEHEHRVFDQAITRLDADDPAFPERVRTLLRELAEHIDKENLGVFPVAVVTLGATGWQEVGRVHDAEPSFLADLSTPSSRSAP